MKAPTLSPHERVDRVNANLQLIQNLKGLTYGTDAYLLSAFIKPNPRGRAVELGAGSGIISLLCATTGRFSHITAVEIQPTYAELIAKNAALNGLEDKVTPLCRDLRDLTPADLGGEVEAVFANPPYMKVNAGKRNLTDEKYQARHEVNGDVDDFCHGAYRLLKHGGRFTCVWRPDRLTDLLAALRAHHLEPKEMVFVQADAHTRPAMVLVEAKKGGSSGLILHPTLLLKQDIDGKLLPDERAEEIYRTLTFPRGGALRQGANPKPAKREEL